MTYGAIPKAMRTPPAGHVAVHVSKAVFPYIGSRWRIGWNIDHVKHAQVLLIDCYYKGQADRKRPAPLGARIALQALARQIRARLGSPS